MEEEGEKVNAVWLVFISIAAFGLAYKFYGSFIARKIFKADPKSPVPSEELRDDVDYIPTNKEVLFGHHFASIAGTGPIVGPAIAIIWGWVPALAWIIHMKFGNTEFITIGVQGIHLQLGHRVIDAGAAIGGGYVVIRHRQVGSAPPWTPASQAQPFERLR